MEGKFVTSFDTTAATILANLPNPVFVIDDKDCFTYLNNAAEVFFQSSQVMLIGAPLATLIPTDSPWVSMLSRARSQQVSVADQGVEFVSQRIGMKIVNVQISPFGERGGGDGQLLVTFQERALAERLRGQSVFHGAARSISAMAALLAHEVKNPLAGIKGAAQLLQADLGAGEAELTRMIVEETDRIASLLDRMEGFAGGASVVLAPVNIHEILDHCLAIATASFGAHLSVSRAYDPSLPVMEGHQDLLIQAFINIIKNASEVTKKGAELIVKTSYSRGRRLSAGAMRAQLNVPIQVEIIDNGPGISADIRDHIFDPFVTAKAGGSGLGLAMVASVVADHGGIVEVDSARGKTVFRINFPLGHFLLDDSPQGDDLAHNGMGQRANLEAQK